MGLFNSTNTVRVLSNETPNSEKWGRRGFKIFILLSCLLLIVALVAWIFIGIGDNHVESQNTVGDVLAHILSFIGFSKTEKVIDTVKEFTINGQASWWIYLVAALPTVLSILFGIGSYICNWVSKLDKQFTKKQREKAEEKIKKYEFKIAKKTEKKQTKISNKALKKDCKTQYKENKK